ncbi:hypothetical protein PG990_004438 [Apiospora arundinis]
MHLNLPPALWAPLLLLLSAATPSAAATKPKNAILLSQVQTLTLRGGGAQTTHRRVSAMPQLQCVSNSKLCRLVDMDVMRCTNQGAGYSGEDIQWSCTASMPPELKLGGTEVMCEGYDGPDDDYVLKGSCGVQYRVVLTEAGERRYPDLAGGSGSWKPNTDGIDAGGILFGILFVGVLAWMVYSACVNANGNQTVQRRPRGGGGGGGGGWGPGFGGGNGGAPRFDDNDDPPPPYSSKSRPSSQQQGWRPGFWTGAASGAAAGYFAGNRGSRQQQSPSRNYGSGWGAGSSGGSGWGAGPSHSSSSSSSSDRHESTGFGGTSRR